MIDMTEPTHESKKIIAAPKSVLGIRWNLLNGRPAGREVFLALSAYLTRDVSRTISETSPKSTKTKQPART